MHRSSAPTIPDKRDYTLFEVQEGSRRVSFTVRPEALEAASNLVTPSTDVLRRKSFDRFRTLIHEAARLKLGRLPVGCTGPVELSRADLECVPSNVNRTAFGLPIRKS